jgi:hypothetical protein
LGSCFFLQVIVLGIEQREATGLLKAMVQIGEVILAKGAGTWLRV